MKSILLTIAGNLIIPICKLINFFFRFQFCHLYTRRIGHQTMNFDIALLSVSNETFLLCSCDNLISNKYILNFFKKQKNVYFSKIFKYFYHSISEVSPNSNLIVSWSQYSPKFTTHLRSNSKIKFPLISEEYLNKILSKNNINKEFVGLHSRNNLYLQKNKIYDPNFHDFRNFDFEDYRLAIEYLNKKNISIIKLGETFNEENIKVKFPNVITSQDLNSDQEIDYILNSYSKFNAIANSGISGISSILRKQIIYINFIPLNLNNLSYCSPGSLILPKKIYNKKKEKFLSFKENIHINFSIHYEKDPYEMNNLSVVNNSSSEILNAIIEMEKLMLNQVDLEAQNLNDMFWQSISSGNNEKINYLKNDLKLTISKNFLKENQNLF